MRAHVYVRTGDAIDLSITGPYGNLMVVNICENRWQNMVHIEFI